MLKREVDLMDSLTDLKDADQIIKAEKDDPDPVHPLDSRFNGLGMQEMSVVDSKTDEFKEISQYLVKTCGQTHSMNYQVRDIFRIERQGENDRFDQSNFSKIKSDRRLLWHGSRATNFGGILSQGLRIAPPEAPVSGYMFGKGIVRLGRTTIVDILADLCPVPRRHVVQKRQLLLLLHQWWRGPAAAVRSRARPADADVEGRFILGRRGRHREGHVVDVGSGQYRSEGVERCWLRAFLACGRQHGESLPATSANLADLDV